MELQIIGWKSCKDTRKAERFFKERGISFQFRDLKEKEITQGELQNICAKVKPEKLVDRESKTYKTGGYDYLEYDPFEKLLENQGLLKTPIVRYQKHVTVGEDEDQWKQWAKQLM